MTEEPKQPSFEKKQENMENNNRSADLTNTNDIGNKPLTPLASLNQNTSVSLTKSVTVSDVPSSSNPLQQTPSNTKPIAQPPVPEKPTQIVQTKKEEKEKENVITKEQTTVDKVEKENIEGNNEEQTNEKKVEENKMEEIKEKKEENNDKKMEEIKENKEEHKMEEEKKEEKKMEEENKVEKKMEEENKVEEIKEKIEENNKKQMEEIKEEEHKMEEVDIINEVKKEKEGEDKKETENKEKLDEVLLGQYKYCRFCEGEPYETSVSYLPIINERVGNFPIVLKSKPKCRSNYICLHHWRENRREYLEHYVQNERSVIDESLVLLYASMIDKKINYSYTPSTNNIQEDTKASFSKYLALRKQQMEMAMGAIPAGLAVTSDLLCNACNSPTQQMFDLSLFPPSFVQFLAWQRLMQIYSKLDSSNIELLNAMKKEALKESDKVVKESVKLTNDNPSEARKRRM
ncbi:hypothetical protein QTN25_004950 [Entamoeba marina]